MPYSKHHCLIVFCLIFSCPASSSLQVVLRNRNNVHQTALQTNLQILTGVDGNYYPLDSSYLNVDMMAAIDSCESPSLAFCQLSHAPPANGLHMAISKISSADDKSVSPASNQPSTASRRFDSNSTRLSHWVTHPGSAGTSAQKPPSSAAWIIAWIFMGIILARPCTRDKPSFLCNVIAIAASPCTLEFDQTASSASPSPALLSFFCSLGMVRFILLGRSKSGETRETNAQKKQDYRIAVVRRILTRDI